jgi:hypothetical protein
LPKYVIVGFFEATKVIEQTLVRNLIELLDEYGSKNRTLFYVKDEGVKY